MKTPRSPIPKLCSAFLASALILTGCASAPIDAGVQGGRAFVVLAVFLVVGAVILYLALGRRE